MGDPAAVLPLHLGFVGESGSAEIFDLARGKKRPASPSTPGDEIDSPKSATSDEWLPSDNGSGDEKKQETHRPFTVADFPRVSCDHDEQADLLYNHPEIKLRGPPAIMLFHPFKSGKLAHFSEYNLTDESDIRVRNVDDCSNECRCLPMELLQFVSAQIAGYQHTGSGPAKIFGFVAARDTINPLRNYVYRRQIDKCEAVTVKSKTGVACLSLTSPARVISFTSRVLIEFELHARNDEETGDSCPIIEGCTELYNMYGSKLFMNQERLYGERCALDIKYLVLKNAVEAQVDVKVLHLGAIPGGIGMKLYAKTSDFSEMICLFQGAAPDLGNTMSFVVGAEKRKGFELYIEGSARDDQKLLPFSWRWGFASSYHAMDEEVAELGEFATVSVKVTWRTHSKKALS